MQSGARYYVRRLDFARGGLQDHPAWSLGNRIDAVAGEHVTAGRLDVVGIRAHDPRVVHNARVGRKQRLDPDAMRLDLSEAFWADHFQAVDTVGLTTLEQPFQPRELALVAGDDDLAAAVSRDALLLAIGVQLALALHAQASLERPRRVIDARVQDTAVVPGLVLTHARLLVEHSQPQTRIAAE